MWTEVTILLAVLLYLSVLILKTSRQRAVSFRWSMSHDEVIKCAQQVDNDDNDVYIDYNKDYKAMTNKIKKKNKIFWISGSNLVRSYSFRKFYTSQKVRRHRNEWTRTFIVTQTAHPPVTRNEYHLCSQETAITCCEISEREGGSEWVRREEACHQLAAFTETIKQTLPVVLIKQPWNVAASCIGSEKQHNKTSK